MEMQKHTKCQSLIELSLLNKNRFFWSKACHGQDLNLDLLLNMYVCTIYVYTCIKFIQ